MRFEIDRCRELYDSADVGIADAARRARRAACAAARVLYAQILDRDRGGRLRRVRQPGPGADLAQGWRRSAPSVVRR